MSDKQQGIIIAYDGSCLLCSSYIHLQRLKEMNYNLTIINFRDDPNLVLKLKHKNMDPNKGFYIKINKKEYFADEAITALALLSTPNSFLSSISKWIFQNKRRARAIYPMLKAGRNMWLKLKNVSPL